MSSEARGTTHYCPSCKAPVDRVDTVCLNCESSRPPQGWPVDPYIGKILAKKYRIDRRLSVGGFGMVFLATQVHQGQTLGVVIIKMLHPEHAFDPVVTKRFINEVKAARSVTNPHVVKIFDVDFDQGNIPYMVQEFVEGLGLAEFLEKHVLMTVPRAVSIGLQVAEGMDEAHQQDIIHRDLKPENIILQPGKRGDFVKIIDFGIARVTTADGLNTASFVGTPRYMPPEQIRGKKLDGRADIFALGVILFEMITGRPPIRVQDSDIEYLTLNTTAEPDHIRDVDPDVPPALDALVHRMMAKDPANRPATMKEIAIALSQISDEAGFSPEMTGEFRVPEDLLTGSTARDLVSTPVSGDFSALASVHRTPQPSDPFTHERPASGQHEPRDGRGHSLPAIALAAGAGAFAVVVAAAVILVVVMSFRSEEDATPDASSAPAVKAEKAWPMPASAKEPPVATPDASSVEDVLAEPAPEALFVAVEPVKPPPLAKKPPKKAVKPAKTGDKAKQPDNPWTKI